jgi:hypothetical protein
MADDYMALADLAIINDSNNSDIDVTELLQDAPVVARMNAVTASNGTLHKYYKTTGAPVVGFRDVNDGREHDSTVRLQVTETLEILDASFTVDTAITTGYVGGVQACLRMEAIEHLRAAFFKLEQQVINGTTEGDANGFTGLADALATVGATVISQGGATALSSVYLVRSDRANVSIVTGMDGNIEIGESSIQRVAGATTGWFNAWVTHIQAWYAMQFSNTYAGVRLANFDAGSNTVTDDAIYEGLAAFPVSRQPNMIIMNRRSLEQLRNSRTATNATGVPAPRPTEVEGIPIIVTDAITSTETVVV